MSVPGLTATDIALAKQTGVSPADALRCRLRLTQKLELRGYPPTSEEVLEYITALASRGKI